MFIIKTTHLEPHNITWPLTSAFYLVIARKIELIHLVFTVKGNIVKILITQVQTILKTISVDINSIAIEELPDNGERYLVISLINCWEDLQTRAGFKIMISWN